MYLIINNQWVLGNQDYAYFTKERFKRQLEFNPGLSSLSCNDIEEILIFSNTKANSNVNAITCKCLSFSLNSDNMRITISEKEEYDNSSGNIGAAIYGYWMRSGKLKKGDFAPDITFLEDYATYTRIKTSGKRTVPMNQSWMATVQEYKSKNEWNRIISMIPDLNTIEAHEVWNSDEGLDEIAFAISQILHRLCNKKIDQEDRKKQDYYSQVFMKIVNRMDEVNPENTFSSSIKAYYYYDQYCAFYKVQDYIAGIDAFESLDDISFINYYRYTRLQQRYAEHFFQYRNAGNKAIQPVSWEQILLSFDTLIDRYKVLPEQEQKKRKKEYIRCLYNSAVIIIENNLPHWDTYFNTVFYKKKLYSFSDSSVKAENLLKEALDLSSKAIDRESANVKPRIIDIHYRLSQLYLSKGIATLLTGKKAEADASFEKSIQEARTAIDIGKQYKSKNIPINGITYVYTPLSQSLFLSGKTEEAFQRVRPREGWQWVDQAQLYLLAGKTDEAKKCLNQVPENDISKNKAMALLNTIEGDASC